jgi:hypothetical protein
LGAIATIVTRDALLRWHRRRIEEVDVRHGARQVSGGLAESAAWVVRMAAENLTWGYMRIQGALKNVGDRVGRSTIARILKGAGKPPVPERPTSWQTFVFRDRYKIAKSSWAKAALHGAIGVAQGWPRDCLPG